MTRLNLLKMSFIATLGLVFVSAASAAGIVVHTSNPNPEQEIPAVAGYQTTGDDMAGMLVTAYFSAAPSESVVWQGLGGGSGEAVGPDSDWALRESGDTFVSPWILTYTAGLGKGLLIGFEIDGFWAGPGEIGVMFDRTLPSPGTPGSARGRDFELVAPVPFDINAKYTGAIGVTPADPVLDEYRWLGAYFYESLAPGGGENSITTPPERSGLDGVNVSALEFYQDTNNPIIPEPASLVLLALSGMLVLRRR